MSVNAGADQRRREPSAERNREPILAVLQRILPPAGSVLEIASGTGQQVVHFAAALPHLIFQPSDPDPACRASIAAWTAETGLANVRPALDLDVRAPDWGIDAADAVICANMIHIAPSACTEGLIAGAARLLPPDGPLALYGPFKRGGAHTAPSNEAFDRSLRAHDPDWGIRDLEAVEALGASHGLALDEIVEMPANNLTVILRKRR
jgi:SAM-dependent methyltransferase